MNKEEFAKEKFEHLLERIKAGTSIIGEPCFDVPIRKLEKALGDNNIDAAMGYLEQICSSCKNRSHYYNLALYITAIIVDIDCFEQREEDKRKYEHETKRADKRFKLEISRDFVAIFAQLILALIGIYKELPGIYYPSAVAVCGYVIWRLKKKRSGDKEHQQPSPTTGTDNI